MWIDLTKTITEDIKSYKGDPKTVIKQVNNVERDGYSLYQLSMGMHTSTHLDGSRHMLNEGPMIDEIPLTQLMGKATVIDARESQFVTDQHKDIHMIQKEDIVLVCGGTSKTVIDESFARELIRKQVKVLGIDFSSPDEPPFPVHKSLFASEILILEHLCNLELLFDKDEIEVIIAPLKVHTDGAPARVYAKY
jgi:kynurenine formamidase